MIENRIKNEVSEEYCRQEDEGHQCRRFSQGRTAINRNHRGDDNAYEKQDNGGEDRATRVFV